MPRTPPYPHTPIGNATAIFYLLFSYMTSNWTVHRCLSVRVHRTNWIQYGEKYPGSAGGMGIPDLREFKKELGDPIPLTAKAGSVAFRSSYLVHAAQPFENRSKQRGWVGYHFHRADNADWCKTTRAGAGVGGVHSI